MVNHYSILGVHKDASADQIRKAYRALAKQYHPDVNTSADAQARFVLINKAYELLSDPVLRYRYNQKIQTSTNPFQNLADFTKQQQERSYQEEMRRQDALRQKRKIEASRKYYPYMIFLYIVAIALIALSIFILLLCGVSMMKHHVLFVLLTIPFLVSGGHVFLYTLGQFKEYKAMYA